MGKRLEPNRIGDRGYPERASGSPLVLDALSAGEELLGKPGSQALKHRDGRTKGSHCGIQVTPTRTSIVECKALLPIPRSVRRVPSLCVIV